MKVIAITLSLLFLFASSAEAKKKKPRFPNTPNTPAKFYNPPAKLLRGTSGTVIWQKAIKGHPRLDAARINRVVMYRSLSTKGKKIAVSGMIHIPKGKAPRGGWPIITWAHGTTGAADRCAPSWENGNLAIDYGGGAGLESLLNSWLRAGFAVVRTDYEGLGPKGPHPYLVGRSAGRSVLDMVRATRNYAGKSRIPVSRKFFIVGHSQGGHAALFAAHMKKEVVPGLDLRGTVSYAPASHLKEQATWLSAADETSPLFGQPSSLTALATMIVRGAAVEDPSISLSSLLSSEVAAFLPALEKTCLPQLGQSDSLGGIAPYTMIQKSANIDPLLLLLDKNQPALKIDGPLLLLQGDQDTTVNPLLTGLLYNKLVPLASGLDYRTYSDADHGSILAESQNDVIGFFKEEN